MPPLRSAADDRALPTCFLHIGTHKTGTTSIQTALASNAHVLAGSGVHVPRNGRFETSGGHHNLAWELNEDPRFSAARGTLADTLKEIAQQRAQRVCLSSEDFEYLHARPQRLHRLADGLHAIGYRAAVVVYLRPQADYLESLYAELVKHGLTLPFDAFLDEVVATGEFTFNERWRFTFEYDQLLDGLASIFGAAQVMARRYDPGAGDVVADFFALIGAGHPELRGRVAGTRRLNAGLRFSEVLHRFETNARASGRFANVPAIPRVRRVGGRFDPVHLREAGRIVDRFNAGNRRVHERYGALVPCVSGPDLIADLAAASGIDPASRYRKRLIDVYAHVLVGSARALPAAADAKRANKAATPLSFTVPARIEALVVLTAALAAIAAFSFGYQSASTTLVEFGLLSTIFAGSAAGLCARYTAEAHGVIADNRFFETWGARLRTFAYAIVGLYAFVNALLDVGVPRYAPDWMSYPGTIAAAAATLVLTVIFFAKQRLPGDGTRGPNSSSCGDDQFFIACGCVAMLVELAHSVVPEWWLETSIDLVVMLLAGVKIRSIWRSSVTREEIDALA